MADQMYDEKKKHPGKRKNSGATGETGVLTPYCVDGATLYCTMGNSSSLLRVENHGLRLTGRAAAHDGDTAPNKNIYPFGSCKLKDNKPCAPSPVGRWLLPDEYAVIGSCYAEKSELYQKTEALMQKARQALAPLCAAEFLLEKARMPEIEPTLRNELYQSVRLLRAAKERMALLSARTYSEPAEVIICLETMRQSAERVQKEMEFMQNVLCGSEFKLEILQDSFTVSGQKAIIEITGMPSQEERKTYQKNINDFGGRAENLLAELDGLSQEAKAFEEAVKPDLGCQITMNSVIPCQLGGIIHF